LAVDSDSEGASPILASAAASTPPVGTTPAVPAETAIAIHSPGDPARLGARRWLAIVVVGFTGQLAWTVENMYLNVYVYDTITADPTAIAVMVALSAVAATLATLIAGAWSDRRGRRRSLIAGGYVFWGFCTAMFGFIGVPEGAEAAPAAAMAALIGVIALDCLMSAIGSSANDAAFGAWVTDVTKPANRGRVDGVLAVLPLIAMLIVFGGLDGLTRSGDWQLFFGIVGGVTVGTGVLSWFLVRDRPSGIRHDEGLLAATVRGLRPSVVRAEPVLYLTLAIWAVIGISSQVFLPYIIIYIQRTLEIDDYALLLGIVLIAASALSVLGGRVMDRVGKERFLLPAVALFAGGLVATWLARDFVAVAIAATIMMAGMMASFATVSALTRDATPHGRAGSVQGLRMLLGVMVPMVIGPFIGAAAILSDGETFVELGESRAVPSAGIFLAAAAVLLLVPVFTMLRARAAGTPGRTAARR
jgi:MFS family permease